jgi:hypothetical protein
MCSRFVFLCLLCLLYLDLFTIQAVGVCGKHIIYLEGFQWMWVDLNWSWEDYSMHSQIYVVYYFT